LGADISVIVITYNQKNKILRCLDSLLQPEANRLEVVIADDCSTDGTQETVSGWIRENSRSFANVVFVRNEVNGGTVRNVTSGINASSGKYIKLIAGDDWFCGEAFETLFGYMAAHSPDVAFSPLLCARELENGQVEITGSRMEASKRADFFDLSPREQFNALAVNDVLPAPGSFFSRRFWVAIELEKYPVKFEEDWPMWVLGTLKEAKFERIEEPLVVYLHHGKSVFQNTASPVFRQVMRDIATMYREIIFPNREKLTIPNLVRAGANYCLFLLLGTLPLNIVHSLFKLKKKNNRGKKIQSQ